MKSFFKKKNEVRSLFTNREESPKQIKWGKKKQGAKQYKTCFHWPLEKKD